MGKPVAGRWLDISDAYGTRREVLGAGLTRLGGGDAEIRLAATGTDQLHVWDDPPRVVFIGAGAPPTCAGVSFEERQLRPGDRIEWVGVSLEYGGEAARADQASVEEVALDAPVGREEAAPARTRTAYSETDARLLRRIRAGLLVDLGKADRKVLKRWQQAVMENRFEAGEIIRQDHLQQPFFRTIEVIHRREIDSRLARQLAHARRRESVAREQPDCRIINRLLGRRLFARRVTGTPFLFRHEESSAIKTNVRLSHTSLRYCPSIPNSCANMRRRYSWLRHE